ncbi:D-glycero-beta-D-manno-heptose 1,7-bisphosphate 7-phosphatase [Sulfurimonas sp.]|uniref:D-glycero-beta-D-manno-heptose 1,7-bisphosphate 7-phosphatase n=1 Tax=Sulfurimonas sp. TaxID=2022749 RepID=UPI00356879B0
MTKALFLDRDGIINVDKKYVHKKDEFEFTDGIFEFCKYFMDNGFLIFVITNQAGIGRGYYTDNDFLTLTEWMKGEFKQNNIFIKDVYHCPHHSEKGIGKYKIDCNCRKPKPGMILSIADKYRIDLNYSILVGDKKSDIEAGIRAKIKNNFLIKSEYQNEYDFKTIKDLLDHLKEIKI